MPDGGFKNTGAAWRREAAAINVHDFPSDADAREREVVS
jgi:hypothetical protein